MTPCTCSAEKGPKPEPIGGAPRFKAVYSFASTLPLVVKRRLAGLTVGSVPMEDVQAMAATHLG